MKLYFKYFAIHLKGVMEYKKSFCLSAFGQFLTSFALFLSVYFMMERFHKVEGYALPEVLLCYSIVLMGYTLAEMFARGFDEFGTLLGNGEFDRVLVRPRSAVFQVMAGRVELARVGRILQAVVMLAWAIPMSRVAWTLPRVLTMGYMILGSAVMFASLFLLYAGLCFFSTEGLEFLNIFTDGGREYGRYPVAIYGKAVLKIWTYGVPMACVQYYPFTYLLGTARCGWYALLPTAGLLFFLPCYLVWRVGVRHFRSTGS